MSFMATLAALGHTPYIKDRTVAAAVAFPGTATATLNFFEAGFLRADTNAGNTVLGTEWANQTLGSRSIAAPYEIRLTVSSGSSPGGSSDSVGSWLSMAGGVGGARKWSLSRSSLNTSTGIWLVEIRSAVTQGVLASATYTVTASVSSP